MKNVIYSAQLLLVSVLWFSVNAMASEESNIVSSNFTKHIYVGAKVGSSSMENSCHSSYQDCDISALGYGIFGGFQVTPWLAMEFGATNYQEYDAVYAGHDVNADIFGYEAAARLSTPLSNSGVEGYVKAGVSYMDITRHSSINLDDVSGVTALGALGLSYSLSDAIAVRLEYQYQPDVGGSQSHFTTLGFTYRFGVTPTKQPKITTSAVTKVATSAQVNTSAIIESVRPTSIVEPSVIKVQFAFDSHILTATTKSKLESVVSRLSADSQLRLIVIGHTDSVGRAAYNVQLSRARAEAIAEYLVANGVLASRIQIQAKGESQPVASNESAAGRQQNRRVEIYF